MYKKFCLPKQTNKQRKLTGKQSYNFMKKVKISNIFTLRFRFFILNFYSEKYKKLNTFKLQRDDNKFSFSIDIFVTFWVAHMLLASLRM